MGIFSLSLQAYMASIAQCVWGFGEGSLSVHRQVVFGTAPLKLHSGMDGLLSYAAPSGRWIEEHARYEMRSGFAAINGVGICSEDMNPVHTDARVASLEILLSPQHHG